MLNHEHLILQQVLQLNHHIKHYLLLEWQQNKLNTKKKDFREEKQKKNFFYQELIMLVNVPEYIINVVRMMEMRMLNEDV